MCKRGIREEIPGHMKRERPKNTSGDDVANEWSTPVSWEEDPAIKAERISRCTAKLKM